MYVLLAVLGPLSSCSVVGGTQSPLEHIYVRKIAPTSPCQGAIREGSRIAALDDQSYVLCGAASLSFICFTEIMRFFFPFNHSSCRLDGMTLAEAVNVMRGASDGALYMHTYIYIYIYIYICVCCISVYLCNAQRLQHQPTSSAAFTDQLRTELELEVIEYPAAEWERLYNWGNHLPNGKQVPHSSGLRLVMRTVLSP
jgi:hypothetical protein